MSDRGGAGSRTTRERAVADAATTFTGLVAIMAAVTYLATLGPTSLQLSTTTMLVNSMIVIGLYVFIGNAGVFSFGHFFFVGVGAYVGSLLVIPEELKQAAYPDLYSSVQSAHLPLTLAVLVAGVAAAIAAGVLAIPLMRLSGLAAALGTFVVLIIGQVVLGNWETLTGGTPGLTGIPSIGMWEVFGWVVVCIAIALAFQQTAACARLRASREDESAARSVGISIGRQRAAAFVISALIVGIAGFLYGRVQGAIFPAGFYLEPTFVTLAMLVVGGMRSLTGAVIGTLALSALAELLTRMQNGMDIAGIHITAPLGTQQVGFALAMLLVLLLRPDGLTKGRELVLRLPRRGDLGKV